MFARTIPDFWQRWHISLGNWFKDYVFFPVSISKKTKKFNKWTKAKFGSSLSKTFSNIIPLCCVWILTGIWHGAAWKYIIWGAFHCVLILSGTIFEKPIQLFVDKLGLRRDNIIYILMQVFRTFLLCTIGRVFFRAGSENAAFDIFKRISTFSTEGISQYFTLDFAIAIILIFILIILELFQENKGSLRLYLQQQKIWIRWIVYYGLIFAILLLGIYGTGQASSSFIYQQF